MQLFAKPSPHLSPSGRGRKTKRERESTRRTDLEVGVALEMCSALA
jgi:hypothetical protein